jgi:hypothetical protein
MFEIPSVAGCGRGGIGYPVLVRQAVLTGRGSTPWFALALLVFGTVYSTAYLGLASRWWFEDDPSLFAYTATIHNPVTIFTDPNTLRHFTGGAALVPMQLLSYWVDIKLAGFSPRLAYAHQICSFLLTLLLLYLLLARMLSGDKIAAFAGSVIWALLPATAVVVQFLATRHYLEGLMFSVLALYLAEPRGSRWSMAAVLSSAAIGMLYKEIYAPVVPALLLVSAWRHRDRAFALLTIGMALAYGMYRFWVLGWGLRYGDMQLLGPWQYLKFLSKLPYTLSSNYGGYCLLGVVLALCAYGVHRRAGLSAVLCFAGLCTVSLLAIVPVSFPLYGMIRRPDPWYRIVFLLHTIVICFGTWFAVRWTPRRVQGGLALLALVILLPGIAKTRELWVEMTSSAEREGKFYLAYPDRLLLSEQEAWWFLPGLTWMYDTRPHYVLIKDLSTTKVDPGMPLWKFSGGSFVPDYHATNR